ncbi:MAG TPA: hypothetical protein VGJ67_00585 [Actinomycetota bacterium]
METTAMPQGLRRRRQVVRLPEARRSEQALHVAMLLSIGVAISMGIASVMGLVSSTLYQGGMWAREAFRGGDLITLVVVVPVLLTAVWLARRGSFRAQAVWIGALAYALYNYAFYVFGTPFNDAFVLHIAAFSMSAFALACALPNLDRGAIADRLRAPRRARWVGGFLVVVGVGQGALWLFLLIRNALTGAVLHDIPVAGQHLVFALDLGFLVPSLIVAGVLLWRGTSLGYVLGTALAVMGLLYQLNAMLAGVFQANADVAGVKALPPEGLVFTAGFLFAVIGLFGPKETAAR